MEDVLKNRENIAKWFGNRFKKERQLKEYNGFIQGSYVEVDFSTLKTRKYKGVDSLLIIAIIPENSSFIGMTGSMDICQAPLNIIKK